jgi:preprotein translocase subunit SecE
MKKFVQFCRECVGELGKVVWPSRSEAVASVKVVIVSTIVVALVLGLLDLFFTEALRLIF